jgi:hypothetical protein
MRTAATIVTILAAAWVGFSAYSLLTHKAFVVDALREYGVPRAWWPWLGLAKAAGAAGLLVGLALPPVGLAAAIGIVLYFTGAIVTIVRARAYSHIAFPLLYAVPVVVAATLEAAA